MKGDSISNSIQDAQSLQIRISKKAITPIYANIYNFSSYFNCCCSWCGLGLYHTGIQIYNYEYMYYGFDGDESGIGYIEPRKAAYQFKEQILLGHTELTLYEIEREILQPMNLEFRGRSIIRKGIDMIYFNLTVTTSQEDLPKCYKQPLLYLHCLNNCRCLFPECILNGRLDWFDFGDRESYSQIRQSANGNHK